MAMHFSSFIAIVVCLTIIKQCGALQDQGKSKVTLLGSNDIKLPLNDKKFGLGRELVEGGEEKRILMNLHVKRMINDHLHLQPSLKAYIGPGISKKQFSGLAYLYYPGR